MEQRLINIYENYLKTKYDKNDINIKIFINNDFLLFWYNKIYIIELNSTMFKIKNPYTNRTYKHYGYKKHYIKYYNNKNFYIYIYNYICIHKHINNLYKKIHKIYKNNILIKKYLYNHHCFYKYYIYDFKYKIYISKFLYRDLTAEYNKYIKIYNLYNIYN